MVPPTGFAAVGGAAGDSAAGSNLDLRAVGVLLGRQSRGMAGGSKCFLMVDLVVARLKPSSAVEREDKEEVDGVEVVKAAFDGGRFPETSIEKSYWPRSPLQKKKKIRNGEYI